MKEKIRVIVKRPGVQPETRTIPNTLEALQELVGGYIETVTLAPGLVGIVNEEGFILDLPYNMDLHGNPIFGTLVIAGVVGEEFYDVPAVLAALITCER